VLRVLYFGYLRDLAGTAQVEMSLPPGMETVGSLRAWLSRDNPALAEALSRPGIRAVVDDEVVPGDPTLSGVEEVAFMPPVSGG